jgi:phytoene dehydrogenase-like protein
MPVPVGGGVTVVDALVDIITSAGGELRLNADVHKVLVSDDRATGVELADGERIHATRAVLASVTPNALYNHLLADADVAPERRTAASAFRYGRAGIQMHIAMSEAPQWTDHTMSDVALVHVLDGMDSLSESVNASNRGFLPRRPTIVVGQPTTVDPSRAPEGKSLLWIQLQENPRSIRGDLADQISSDGTWSDATLEAYTERVIAQLEPHITNIRTAATGRVVLGPQQLQSLNANLVGGDPYAGDCRVDQYALWRPLSTATGHETGVRGLWQIGASTHPGPGLGGGSGFLVAQRLLS